MSNIEQEEDEINLLDLLIVLAKNKWFIIISVVLAALISAAVAMLLPKIYTAKAVILPPQQGQSTASAMLGQLGALAGGAGAALGVKNPDDMYIGILKSRTLEDKIINRFNLQKYYHTKLLGSARTRLAANTVVSAGKDGFISLEFSDKNPQLAAAVANAYFEELDKLVQNLAITDAAQRRLLYEKQIALAKNNLAKSEYALQQIQAKSGLIEIFPQEKEIAATNASLRAEIAAKEIQLSTMRIGVTERNPAYLRTEQELAGLKNQLSSMNPTANNTDSTAKNSAGLDYINKFSDVKYNQAIIEMLFKQLEIARIDEAKDGPLIQVLDKAVVPEKRSKPKRALIVILSTLITFFLSVVWAFIREAQEKSRLNPENAEKLVALRRYSFGK